MIHLDAKTDYSFMRGFGSPEQWLARATEIEATAFGVADYCSTWGHAAFREKFAGSKTKLLYGVQLPVVTTLDKDPRHGLVTVIAKHKGTGLSDLYQLVGKAHEQSYYRPRVTWKQLRELKGVCEVIINDAFLSDYDEIVKMKGAYIAARPRKDQMLTYVREGVLPVVATASPVYPSIAERPAFELVQAISGNARQGEAAAGNLHMLRRSEYEAVMKSLGVEAKEEWFELAKKIADNCKSELTPAVPVHLEGDLEQLARQGARKLGVSLKGPYKERLARELSVIKEKKFESYFLFVHSLVGWAKSHMLVGPGRGSAGGSLLCYLLGITAVDPIKHGTLFERFIDITRPDWPDIDIDFPDARRELVFDYLRDTYGREYVARLGTISEFGGKSALNDTAKATGVPIELAREIGKYTEGPAQQTFSLAKTFAMVDEKLMAKAEPLRIAEKIEGHPRHHGVHAAGVVVNNTRITCHGSVDKAGVIAMDMKQAEKLGMIKVDVLGLKTLSVIQDVCDQIGMDAERLYALDLHDVEVYEGIFSKDRVTGVFQFEGPAVRNLMKQVPVDQFEDLCALTSLARPGPLMGGAADAWVKRRRGEEEWDYLHPSMEKHTRDTFGTIIYQEQAMGIVRDLGGFSEPEVNGFRRAVGKKDPEKLASYRTKFVENCGKLFEDEEKANELWDTMCEFGSYAFNRSHAVAYSMISYITAWLKHKHGLEFALAQLRCAADEDHSKQLLRELAEEGHKVVPFDPANSLATWSIHDGRLLGGFDSVKGVGAKTAKTLLAAREADPENWLSKLTASQRDRITRPGNTPWHSLSYFAENYGDLYKGESVVRIRDIPPAKGTYEFLGKISKVVKRDLNDAAGLAKRDGRVEKKNTYFINVFVADDTDEVGMTINRWKSPTFEWLLEENLEGRDFRFTADIINEGDGRRWLFLNELQEMKK